MPTIVEIGNIHNIKSMLPQRNDGYVVGIGDGLYFQTPDFHKWFRHSNIHIGSAFRFFRDLSGFSCKMRVLEPPSSNRRRRAVWPWRYCDLIANSAVWQGKGIDIPCH